MFLKEILKCGINYTAFEVVETAMVFQWSSYYQNNITRAKEGSI